MARAMKDSGIEWFSSIPEEWNIVQVKQLFSIGRGRVIATTELSDYGYPVYSSQTKNNGVLGYIDTYDFDRSQLTWTTDGANAGTVFLREGKHNCTNVCGTLLPRTEKNNLHFLKYILEYTALYHKRADINGFKIMNNEMAEIKIVLPPIDEQQKIANFLDSKCASIDAVIEKTKASIEEYKKLKQAIITQAVTKGIRPNREMKDSGIEWIGEIPEEWNVVKGHRIIASTQNGLTRRDLDKSEGNIVLKLKNINESGNIDYSDVNRIELSETEKETYRLSNGDFLFVRVNGSKNLVGKCAIYEENGEDVAYNDHIIRVKLNENIDGSYLQLFLLSQIGRTEINLHTSTAAGQFTISGEGIRDLNIILPTKQEQVEIVEHVKRETRLIEDVLEKKENVINEQCYYKKSLIYEYVTGKKEIT